VPETLRERVFDPFFTTKSPDQGTGLGLSLAFDIARDHGGVLEERSARGRGATFVLRLPTLGGEPAA
jgi:signal transduction histidine kinase